MDACTQRVQCVAQRIQHIQRLSEAAAGWGVRLVAIPDSQANPRDRIGPCSYHAARQRGFSVSIAHMELAELIRHGVAAAGGLSLGGGLGALLSLPYLY